jgi:uncharacterized membrane protein YfcA
MNNSYYVFLIIGLAFVLAGFVKGMIGMGLPTVAMGLLALVMTPAQGAAILVLPSIVTNTWQLLAGPSISKLLLRLWTFLIGVCLGTWAGAGLMTGPNAGFASVALGVTLAIYSLLGLFSVQFSVPTKTERWLSPLIGAATGVVAAATGIFAVPAIPYLQALGFKRDDLIQALGLFFSIATLALSVNLVRDGSLQVSVLQGSLIALATAGTGMVVGTWLRNRVSAEVFRRCFFAGMLVLGTSIAIRALL